MDINEPKLFWPKAYPATASTTWYSFSDVKNNVLHIWQKNTNDDNDGCNDNYDGYFGDVDDNDDKNYQNMVNFEFTILGPIT